MHVLFVLAALPPEYIQPGEYNIMLQNSVNFFTNYPMYEAQSSVIYQKMCKTSKDDFVFFSGFVEGSIKAS